MARYLLNRVLRGIVSIILVVAIIMLLIYSLMDKQLVFAQDSVYRQITSNQKTAYKYRRWADFGYYDTAFYGDYIIELVNSGELSVEDRASAGTVGDTPAKDNPLAREYIKRFTEKYEAQGYTVERLNAVMNGNKYANGGNPQLFAYKATPLLRRLWNYFSRIVTIDSVRYAKGDIENRGITFTWFDPVYGGEKFSPAIIGNGTKYKYLLYFDSQFPYVHQNVVTINLGVSYSVNKGVDVFETMTVTQGAYVSTMTTYPTGYTELSADDLHTARYVQNSLSKSDFYQARFVDDYTNTVTVKSGFSKMGYSFVIGIIAVLMAYFLGLPLGVIMARNKDKLIDHIGTVYIVFIIAVPSLAYIFLFKAIGGKIGLPTSFKMDSRSKLMYILPIVSLALPSIANLMKWLRRFMIDQMNSDYVKFARSGGLSEGEIFSKHILKNAAIPIVHGIPASVLGALVGAIVTERVYVVPGAGNLLTQAINMYDNNVIVGVSLFYAVLNVLSIIIGDLLMSMVDPRISFTTRGR